MIFFLGSEIETEHEKFINCSYVGLLLPINIEFVFVIWNNYNTKGKELSLSPKQSTTWLYVEGVKTLNGCCLNKWITNINLYHHILKVTVKHRIHIKSTTVSIC